MAELRVSQLIQEGHTLLENKFEVLGHIVVNRDEVQDILNRIDSLLPEEIKNAEIIIKRYDDIIKEAQMRAERIVKEANDTAEHILSESETVRRAKEEEKRIKEQLVQAVESMKGEAVTEAENIRQQAYKEAEELRANADSYAEQILGSINSKLNEVQSDIGKLHTNIEKGQRYLEQKRMARKAPQTQESGNSEEYYEE